MPSSPDIPNGATVRVTFPAKDTLPQRSFVAKAIVNQDDGNVTAVIALTGRGEPRTIEVNPSMKVTLFEQDNV